MSSLRRLLERRWRRLRQALPSAERRRVRLHSDFAAEYGLTVLHGPFRGMAYPDSESRSRSVFNLAARCEGCELELLRPDESELLRTGQEASAGRC